MSVQMENQPLLLIVDDVKTNLKLLSSLLRDEYQIRVALNGVDAIKRSLIQPVPDLILMDVMMPEMDGYEACRQIKANPETGQIPIIFLTAKTETNDLVTGFKAGASDFLAKPFQVEELKARVKVHLDLKNSYEKIARQKEELLQASAIREDVDRIMRHDLKGLLTAIMTIPPLLINRENLSDKGRDQIRRMNEAARKMRDMINLSMDLFKMESGQFSLSGHKVDIRRCLSDLVHDFEGLLYQEKIKLVINFPKGKEWQKIYIYGTNLLFYTMISNITRNAIEAGMENETVVVDIKVSGDNVTIAVKNKQAVPDEVKNSFFEIYSSYGKTHGSGIGTYSAKLMASSLGGTIDMTSSDDFGTIVQITLPLSSCS